MYFHKNLTAERLRELLTYDPETGIFTRRVRISNCPAGMIAGTYNISRGQRRQRIGVDGRVYKAHRLAWLYVHGKWPAEQIDHIDGNAANNRIANLREASPTQQMHNKKTPRNNKVGFKGVTKAENKFSARIQAFGKRRRLGRFATPEEAGWAYAQAAKSYHGEFARAPLLGLTEPKLFQK